MPVVLNNEFEALLAGLIMLLIVFSGNMVRWFEKKFKKDDEPE